MLIEDPETSAEEEKVDNTVSIEGLIKKLSTKVNISDFTTPELVSEEEKRLWRHTYDELKVMTKTEWEGRESE